MDTNNEKNEKKFRSETIIVVVSLVINFGVMVNWFTALENRLTRIETTIDIKLADKPHYLHKPQTNVIVKPDKIRNL